jgi:DNA invertase Pin-like site-specific DNA recombinase
MGHLLGYARVSTTDQQPQLQIDALQGVGCYRVFTETASGARADGQPWFARRSGRRGGAP